MSEFNGLGMNLGNLARLSKSKTRSICPENPTGEKGKAAMSAYPKSDASWSETQKLRPTISIEPGQVATLADIEGPGAIQSIWNTGCAGRDAIIRFYWDGQERPSVECPLSDFFALPWLTEADRGTTSGPLVTVNSLPVSVNPNRGLNCYWEMPFRKHCRITLENIHPRHTHTIYYQINYTLTDVFDDCAYFHAQFRRVKLQPIGSVYIILDDVKGLGHYVEPVPKSVISDWHRLGVGIDRVVFHRWIESTEISPVFLR